MKPVRQFAALLISLAISIIVLVPDAQASIIRCKLLSAPSLSVNSALDRTGWILAP